MEESEAKMEEENKSTEKDGEERETYTINSKLSSYKEEEEEEEYKEVVETQTTPFIGLVDEIVRAILRCLGFDDTTHQPQDQDDQPSHGGEEAATGGEVDGGHDAGDPSSTADPPADDPPSTVDMGDMTRIFKKKPPTPPLGQGRDPPHH